MNWNQKYYQENLSKWVENMEALLKKPKPCDWCPHGAGPNYFMDKACKMCLTFMGLDPDKSDYCIGRCPCIALKNSDKAIMIATLAIEDYHRNQEEGQFSKLISAIFRKAQS